MEHELKRMERWLRYEREQAAKKRQGSQSDKPSDQEEACP